MSTNGLRDFRPKLHFTPQAGWINDPNGLVYADGVYHLFYQYYPADTVWGPMHWGHAVSTDLIRWQHQPVSLYPDRNGSIFSGSAVYDEENTSGLGAFGKAPYLTLYTLDASQHTANGAKHQEQHLAYSLDGVHFKKYPGNPVIPNPGISDFRDPKAFWNPVKNCWSCVLSIGTGVRFYASPDMIHWTQTGEFHMKDTPSWKVPAPKPEHLEMGTSERAWECPDFFPLQTREGEKWVLICSIMPLSDELLFSRTEYFIGDFDGDTFHWDGSFTEPAWVDEGFDNYAGVTYNNLNDRVFIGMGANWGYQWQEPTGEYCGLMTLPRKLSLVKTPHHGYRLASQPAGIGGYIQEDMPMQDGDVLPSEVFAMEICGDGPCEISFVNAGGQELRFGVNEENELFLDRGAAGDTRFNEKFALPAYCKRSVRRFMDGRYKIEAVFDVSQLELFMDEGTMVMSANVFPDTPYQRIRIFGQAKVRYFSIRED